MSEDSSIEELIARLAKLDDERAKLLEESARLREQLLEVVARGKNEKTAVPPPGSV